MDENLLSRFCLLDGDLRMPGADGMGPVRERESEISEKVSCFIFSWNGLLYHRTGVIKEGLASFLTLALLKKLQKAKFWDFIQLQAAFWLSKPRET